MKSTAEKVRTRLGLAALCAALLATPGCSNDRPLNTLLSGNVLTEGVQTVPLGGQLYATLPTDRGWSCAHEDSVTVHVHTNAEAEVDVMIVAESSHPILTAGDKTAVIDRELDTIHMVEEQAQQAFLTALSSCVTSYKTLEAQRYEQRAPDPYAGVNSNLATDPYAGINPNLPTGPSAGVNPNLATDPYSGINPNLLPADPYLERELDAGPDGDSADTPQPPLSNSPPPAVLAQPHDASSEDSEFQTPDTLTEYCVAKLNKQGYGRAPFLVKQLRLMFSTRTQGQGLGFVPEPSGFLGWNWVGRFDPVKTDVGPPSAAIDYRIGSRRGLWTLPHAKTKQESTTRTVPALHILAHYTQVFPDGTRGNTPTYVSVLCQSSGSGCVQGDALITTLSRIQSNADPRAAQRACEYGSIGEMADKYGFTLLGDLALREIREGL